MATSEGAVPNAPKDAIDDGLAQKSKGMLEDFMKMITAPLIPDSMTAPVKKDSNDA